MTGFGTGTAEGERFRITVTLRAVNHRYLDLVLRLRDDLRQAERPLRELLTDELLRGRVEVVLEIESLDERPVEVRLDRGLLRQLHLALGELAEKGLVSAEVTLSDLLRLPEAVRVEVQDPEWRDGDLELLHHAAARALAQLVAARVEEGKRLAGILDGRLGELDRLSGVLRSRAERLPAQIADSLAQRIEQSLGEHPAPEEGRLAQEVALLVDRSDVREELDRLDAHLEHFRQLAGADGSIGKRLDFLAQEIFRELNTMGAKCRDAELVALVLEGKAVCEQIREQVQNVE
ncbi:MAG: YicC family protein [Holophagales bacterium]|nr:YicC family protein [Holophagales bacterium]